MSSNTPTARNSSSSNRPLDPRRRHRADFARDIMFAEFGYQHAKAIDYDGFCDRKPTLADMWWRSEW